MPSQPPNYPRSAEYARRAKANSYQLQDAAAFEEMFDAIRGIQRGLEAMKEGAGKPFRVALDEIRARQRISRRRK